LKRRFEFSERHLGTPIRLVILSEDEASALDVATRAFKECARIEKLYSRFLPNNDLATLNARVGEWTPVSPELYQLLQWGEAVKLATEGAFDLSVKSILEGWGYDASYSFEETRAGQIGSMELLDGAVRLAAPIELGGLGKGYAIDQVGKILEPLGDFLIDAGGDLLLQGHDENGALWRVAFEHPTDLTQAIGIFEGTHLALACSSPSRRQWKSTEGKRHHLVDPRTREPAQNMLAVYTQASTALIADSYSTALFVLGFERAQALLPSLPVEAMLVGPEGKLFKTPGFLGELFTQE
jgi:thiamine biosynthesis lipoprotein